VDEARLQSFRNDVEEVAAATVVPHLRALESRCDPARSRALVEGLAGLDLDLLDLSTPDGRHLLSAALEQLTRHGLASAVLCLADAAGQLFAPDPTAPEGPCAFPLFTGLDPERPRLTLRFESGAPRVSGTVEGVVGAFAARWLVLPAAKEDEAVASHIVRVHSAARGVRWASHVDYLRMRRCPTADVSLHDVPVAPGHLVPLEEGALERLRGPALAVFDCVVWSWLEHHVHDGECDDAPALADARAALAVCVPAIRALCTDPTRSDVFLRARRAAERAAASMAQTLEGHRGADRELERPVRDAQRASLLLRRIERAPEPRQRPGDAGSAGGPQPLSGVSAG